MVSILELFMPYDGRQLIALYRYTFSQGTNISVLCHGLEFLSLLFRPPNQILSEHQHCKLECLKGPSQGKESAQEALCPVASSGQLEPRRNAGKLFPYPKVFSETVNTDFCVQPLNFSKFAPDSTIL